MASEPARDQTLEERVASLERTVRELANEVARVGAVGDRRVAREAPAAPAVAPPTPPMPAPSAIASMPGLGAARSMAKIDFEALVGRYGTLVLATISALAAV